ncbi:MAG: hypothetical protein Q8N51_20780 [Gammaproteobacteria bacterium]|nr:hypothetical protein [Gammaproteobacteria bacterium]
MKSSHWLILAAAFGFSWLAAAQIGSPPARQIQPSTQDTAVVHDGIVFYRGQTYLIRNGRAAMVDTTLVAEGQVLTPEGRRVLLPENILTTPSPLVRDGLFTVRGQTYLIRDGRTVRIDAKLIPDGQVLTAENRLVPLPSDFSGFVLDRAPDGTVLPKPPAQSGPQVLSGQAGVPQVPSPVEPQPPQHEDASNQTGANAAANPKGTAGADASSAASPRPKPDVKAPAPPSASR